jgi:hypothetical protein
MVLSLAIGAFMQQAIRTVPCNISVAGVNATIAVAQYPHPWMNDSDNDRTSWEFDSSTKTRIISALSSRYVTRPTFLQNCLTGNCTFSPVNGVTHVTSGFCSRCVESTNSLRFGRVLDYGNWGIGNVVRLESSPSLLLAFEIISSLRIGMAVNGDMGPLEALRGSVPDDATAAINVASITEASCSPGMQCSHFWNDTVEGWDGGWKKHNVVSISCGLYPCARHMTAEVRNNTFEETVLREELYEGYDNVEIETPVPSDGTFRKPFFLKPVAFHAPCWLNGTRYDKPPGNLTVTTDRNGKNVHISQCAFGVSRAFNRQVGSLMRSIASGNCSISPFSTEPSCRAGETLDVYIRRIVGPLGETGPINNAEFWWLENLYNSGRATFESISTTMDNVAMAITDSARAQPFPGISYVPGTIWKTSSCTEFNWPWLIFPAALIILAAASLASITLSDAWSRDGAPMWKSSILPFILRDERERGLSTDSSSLKDLKQIAKENNLILEREDDRWEFKVSPMVERTKRRASL